MPNWTPKQKEVIDARDQNILVSAAAGSGKNRSFGRANYKFIDR